MAFPQNATLIISEMQENLRSDDNLLIAIDQAQQQYWKDIPVLQILIKGNWEEVASLPYF